MADVREAMSSSAERFSAKRTTPDLSRSHSSSGDVGERKRKRLEGLGVGTASPVLHAWPEREYQSGPVRAGSLQRLPSEGGEVKRQQFQDRSSGMRVKSTGSDRRSGAESPLSSPSTAAPAAESLTQGIRAGLFGSSNAMRGNAKEAATPRVSISLVATKSKPVAAKFQLNARSLGFGNAVGKASDIKTEPPESEPPAEPPHRLPEARPGESPHAASAEKVAVRNTTIPSAATVKPGTSVKNEPAEPIRSYRAPEDVSPPSASVSERDESAFSRSRKGSEDVSVRSSSSAHAATQSPRRSPPAPRTAVHSKVDNPRRDFRSRPRSAEARRSRSRSRSRTRQHKGWTKEGSSMQNRRSLSRSRDSSRARSPPPVRTERNRIDSYPGRGSRNRSNSRRSRSRSRGTGRSWSRSPNRSAKNARNGTGSRNNNNIRRGGARSRSRSASRSGSQCRRGSSSNLDRYARSKPNLGRNGPRKGEEKGRVDERKGQNGANVNGRNKPAANGIGGKKTDGKAAAPRVDAAISIPLLSTEGLPPAPVVIIKERAVARPVREGWKPCPPRDPEKPNRGKFRLRGLKTDGTTGPRPGVEIIRPTAREEESEPTATTTTTTNTTEKNETDTNATNTPAPGTPGAADAVKSEPKSDDSSAVSTPSPPKKSLLVQSLTLPPDAEIWAFRGDMLDTEEVKQLDVINASTLEAVEGGIDAALGLGDADFVSRDRADPAAFSSYLDSGHPPHHISLCLAGAKGGRAYLTGTLAALDARSNLYVIEAEETSLTVEIQQPKADPFIADLRMDDLELDADPFALIDDFYDSKATPPPVAAPVEKKVVVVSKRPIKGVLIKGDRIAAGKLGA